MRKRTPTGGALIVMSWFLVVSGIVGSAYLGYLHMWMETVIVFIGGLVLGGMMRILANIGELLFYLSGEIAKMGNYVQNIDVVSERLQMIDTDLHCRFEGFMGRLKDMNVFHQDLYNFLEENAENVNGNLRDINQAFAQLEKTMENISCDSRDINQNLFKLTAFLDNIQKSLDLKE